MPLTRSFPHSFSDLPPQGSGAGRRAELGRPTHGRGRNHFLDPPGPRPALGRPGSPERDCGPGCQSRNRPELSTSRTRCSALHARLGSSLGITGPGPGETDSDVSLQQNSVIRWTRMGDPHVRAGEVVIRKLQVTVFLQEADSSSGRPEQFLLHHSDKVSSASTRSRKSNRGTPLVSPADPANFNLSNCFSALLPSSMSHPYPTHFHF